MPEIRLTSQFEKQLLAGMAEGIECIIENSREIYLAVTSAKGIRISAYTGSHKIEGD